MTEVRSGTPSLRWPVLLVLLVAGFVFHVRLGGLDVALWPDTIFDSQAVAACLDGDRCLDRGVATSVPGLRHGTTWLHWRTLAAWAGLDLSAVHLLLHLAGALTFVVTALAAAGVAGPWAGVGAALMLAYVHPFHDCQWSVVYNNRILPLIGTLAWALCVAALSRRRAWPLFLAAGVGAVTTEVHVVFLLFWGCLVVSALWLPRRWRVLAIALGTYAVGVVALAPGTWASNVAGLWRGVGPSPYAVGEVTGKPLVVENTALAGVAILAVGLLFARGDRRRRLAVLLAFTVPIMVVYEAAVLGGVTSQTDKYLGAWLGGIAASVACGAFALVDRVREVVGRVLTLPRWPDWTRGPLSTALQCLVAAGVAVWPDTRPWVWKAPGDLPALEMEDARRVAEAARSRGWTLERTLPRLRSLQGHDLVQWIPLVSPWEEAHGPSPDPRTSLTVLRVLPSWLPEAMPAGWEVLDRGRESVLLAVWAESWVDWDRFEVCLVGPGEPRCHGSRYVGTTQVQVEENQVLVPHWPWPTPGADGVSGGRGEEGRTTPMVEVRLHVRFPPSGGEQRVFVPVLIRGCAGHVASAPGAGSLVSPDGRSAVIRADGREEGGALALRWRVGGRDCPAHAWPYGIPFFVEAPAEDARLLEDILSRGRAP